MCIQIEELNEKGLSIWEYLDLMNCIVCLSLSLAVKENKLKTQGSD